MQVPVCRGLFGVITASTNPRAAAYFASRSFISLTHLLHLLALEFRRRILCPLFSNLSSSRQRQGCTAESPFITRHGAASGQLKMKIRIEAPDRPSSNSPRPTRDDRQHNLWHQEQYHRFEQNVQPARIIPECSASEPIMNRTRS